MEERKSVYDIYSSISSPCFSLFYFKIHIRGFLSSTITTDTVFCGNSHPRLNVAPYERPGLNKGLILPEGHHVGR
nr:hypothetical protein [Tanacetum cinerariifolium]